MRLRDCHPPEAPMRPSYKEYKPAFCDRQHHLFPYNYITYTCTPEVNFCYV